MPDMEFQRTGLREPEESRHVVAQQVFVAFVLVVREDSDGFDELRPLLFPMLLVETLSRDAFWHAYHRQRTVSEMRYDEGRHLREIAQQIAFRQRRLLERRISRPVHTIEMRKADAMGTDGQRKVVFLSLQLRQNVRDLA